MSETRRPSPHSQAHEEPHALPGWKPCPEGRFASLSSKLRRGRSRREFLRTVGAAAAIFIAGGGIMLAGRTAFQHSSTPSQIFCKDVPQLITKLQNHTITTQEQQLLTAHLDICAACRKLYRQRTNPEQSPRDNGLGKSCPASSGS